MCALCSVAVLEQIASDRRARAHTHAQTLGKRNGRRSADRRRPEACRTSSSGPLESALQRPASVDESPPSATAWWFQRCGCSVAERRERKAEGGSSRRWRGGKLEEEEKGSLTPLLSKSKPRKGLRHATRPEGARLRESSADKYTPTYTERERVQRRSACLGLRRCTASSRLGAFSPFAGRRRETRAPLSAL